MLVGSVLAERYKLIRKLGEGAMGWVFLGEHTEIGKKYAVKVLRPALCRMPEAVRRFRREARAATQIGSRHIVDVSDFGTTSGGAAFFVMEHLEGGEDLGTTIRREGRLPWLRVRHILLQLCDALQAAHDADIIHRDVKPANVYRIEREGDPDYIKVLDFGIARLTASQDSIVTQTGTIMGTPDFMAPEQAQGRHVDHRADMYSLAATAYAMLTGRPPFVGSNEYDVIYKQLNEEPKPPSQVVPDAEIPKWFEDAILRAMRKKPEERFESMRDFAKALQDEAVESDAARTGPSGETRPAEVPARSAATEPARTSGISPRTLAIAAFLLACVGALGYVLVFSSG